ncbi:DUF1156 domain-containing protein [Stygiolobus caldivivus]|uniref:DUF1156 domain-containing protein n=1 Tax=Stygiolobus caldivivus TaxID=2824673 RepID=A0A8D5ZJ79_9CREN|nr:DUF1156 domain-containing protein [Stygiolobus caldivivus]BCU70065.1 hypothetical protein KN1_13620 [Stygiolobus caldivivus]
MQKRLIESDKFSSLIPEIDEKAVKEKGSGRPTYWGMVFWRTRKPLVSARAFIAASLLPEGFNITEYKRIIRLNEDIPHKYQPITNNVFKDYVLLDPFAGFGSIPLEAKRLGLGKVIASELLPTAYMFLKAVLDYPKYGEKLLKDIERYGNELIKSLEEDVKELYGDTTGFVGSWEVKCPHCGNYTPLVNQWWLLALKEGSSNDEEEEGEESEVKSGAFRRLVYMEPVKEGNQIRVKVIDLNKELNVKSVRAKKTKDKIIVNGKEYRVSQGNVNAKKSFARCLHCNNVFPKDSKKWYVKEAINEWNENYEKFMNGEITLEELRNSRARPTLLVKFKGKAKDLTFEEITVKDEEAFWDSFDKLRGLDITKIPTEKASPYGTLRFVTWGIDRFYKLFNARQLIILTKIVEKISYLRDIIEGDDEYKKAVITYLVLAFLNHIRYNCMLTSVHPTRTFVREATALTRFSFMWNWIEISPLANIIGSFSKSLEHVNEGLEYLIQTDSDSQVEVLQTDVCDLRLDPVDVIITDPPYADDVPYPEVGDFYYVWLKKVFPFPYNTQWEELVPKDIGVDEARNKVFGNGVGTYDYFRERLAQAFANLSKLLKGEGVLVTFYNHTSPKAWTSLLYAGWYYSKFRISTTYAITTEDETRINARGTVSLDKSIVIVWRKRAEGTKHIQEVKKNVISAISDWISTNIKSLSLDTYIEVLGKVLSEFTKYEKLLGLKGEGMKAVEDLVSNHVFPTVVQSLIEGLAKGTGARVENPYSVFYVLVKALLPPSKTVRKLDKNTLIFLNVSGNITKKDLLQNKIIKAGKDTIYLMEPENANDINDKIRSFEMLNHVKSAIAGDYNFSNPVQVLHYLEYIALKYPDKLKEEVDKLREKTRFVDEALSVAKIFTKVLNEKDVEYGPSCKMVGGCEKGIEKWVS